MRGDANPPWSLVGRTLSQVQTQQANIVLVAHCVSHTTVPNYAIDADRVPSVNNIKPSSDAQSEPIDDAPTTSRMAYLRERYRGRHLSEEATDLMLKLWRTKTNRSHDSLFTKWECWCSEQGSDPISGSAIEVTNFLAYLYKEGYQYSSIKSY